MTHGIVHTFDGFFRRLSARQQFMSCYGLIVLIAAADYATGIELSSSILYVLPVLIATWYLSRKQGVFAAYLCAAIWTAMDLAAGHEYSNGLIIVWNWGVRLGLFLIIAELAAAFKQQLDRESTAAKHDALTGIQNRRGFLDSAEKAIGLCRRARQPVTLAFIDLDNFKHVNDALGHDEGDRVLRTVAAEIGRQIRKTDECSRLGGDEFAVLLVNSDPTAAEDLIKKMISKLQATVAKNDWPISFSVGIVTSAASDTDPDTMIREADKLMYEAKNAGKNSIRRKTIAVAPSEASAREHPISSV